MRSKSLLLGRKDISQDRNIMLAIYEVSLDTDGEGRGRDRR